VEIFLSKRKPQQIINILLSIGGFVRPSGHKKGCDTLMQHEGQMGMNPQEMLKIKMWEKLN
jgi:hypothetical protein